MSKVTEQVKEEFIAFASKYGPKTIVPATVTAINDDDTVKIEFSDESTIDDARLRSVVKAGNKVLFIPKVGSIVQVARVENSDEYIVIAVEEISDVVFEIGTSKFKLTDTGLEVSKGDTTKFNVEAGGFKIENGADNLKDTLNLIIDAVMQIVVIQGNNPSYSNLTQAKTKVQNIFS